MQVYANLIRKSPFYEKDKNGKRTDVVKGYVLECLETKKTLDGVLYGSMLTVFPDVAALPKETAMELTYLQLIAIELELLDSKGRMRVASVVPADGITQIPVETMLQLD